MRNGIESALHLVETPEVGKRKAAIYMRLYVSRIERYRSLAGS
jgi:hypothetical protein